MPMDNSPLKHSIFWPVSRLIVAFGVAMYILQFLFIDMISILNDSSIYVRLVML